MELRVHGAQLWILHIQVILNLDYVTTYGLGDSIRDGLGLEINRFARD